MAYEPATRAGSRVPLLIVAGILTCGLVAAFMSSTTLGSRGRSAVPVQRAVEPTVAVEASASPAAPDVAQEASAALIPVFTYHHVSPTADNFIAVTPETFEKHLRIIRDEGYTPLTADELASLLDSGSALPKKPVMITFDDGWSSQYQYAKPLLDQYGFKATFFVYPSRLRGGTFMSQAQVRKLSQAGHSVGSHTWNHLPLVRKKGETAEEMTRRTRGELTKTTAWLERVCGKPVTAFAYPFGYHEQASRDIVATAGHTLAFTVDEGPANADTMDRLLMDRFTVLRSHSIDDFTARLHSTPLALSDMSPPNGTVQASTRIDLLAATAAGGMDVSTIKFVVDEKAVATKADLQGGNVRFSATWRGSGGYHYISLRGRDDNGGLVYASWGVVTGR